MLKTLSKMLTNKAAHRDPAFPAPVINRTVLMSGADYFSDEFAINAYMDSTVPVDTARAVQEHNSIKAAFAQAGITVISTPAPQGMQDGVYTANWGVSRGDSVLLSNLPNQRKGEEVYAEQAIRGIGKKVIHAPYLFSGQGDALPCGSRIFVGTGYRTDKRMHTFIARKLGFDVISVQTIPVLDSGGKPVINAVSGLPDSFFYDLDLSMSILSPHLIAWCPQAFTPESQNIIRNVPIGKIEVDYDEAVKASACNLVSTGSTVIMGDMAPKLQAAVEAHGFKTIPLPVRELMKGGGFIRCTSMTLDNE
jgi:N-dimethylarginine dimethylaminohydrolase